MTVVPPGTFNCVLKRSRRFKVRFLADAALFSLLIWNARSQRLSLISAFAELARLSDLIFLQEAVPLKKTQTVIEQSLFEAFVRGYVQNEVETGVLTLARTPHLVHFGCWRQNPTETPKATSVTLYPLPTAMPRLLTVNLHRELQLRREGLPGQLDKVAE